MSHSQKEAMETGAIYDAAVNLAVTNVEDRQKMLDNMVSDHESTCPGRAH